jgi:hypothetical protein
MRIKEAPTPDTRALLDLRSEAEFVTFVPSANPGTADAAPIKKAPIDVIRVVLKASMAFSSRYRPEKLGTAVSGTLYAGTFAIGGVKSDRTTKGVLEMPQIGVLRRRG